MQRYFAQSIKNDLVFLSEDDLYHIKTVMRMKNNNQIEVVFNEQLFLCNIIDIKNNIIKTIKQVSYINDKRIKTRLIIPLLQEQKMRLIIEKATELGVDEIVPFVATRSKIKLDDEKFGKKLERWMKISKSASEQSKRIDIPHISNLKHIEELKNIDGERIVCSTSENVENIKNCLKNNSTYDKINIVIGPEGGLTNEEENKLVDLGFKRVSLGKNILRVETVPIVVLSIINYEFME